MSDTMEVMRWLHGEGMLTEKPTRALADRYRKSRPQPAVQYREWNPFKGWAMIVDIDGTLARMTTRGPFDADRYMEDELHVMVFNLIQMYRDWVAQHDEIVDVIITSGRYDGHRSATADWLQLHGIDYDDLLMRPGADVHDKDGDHRNDAIVKRELFERHIDPHYNVLVALDDRNRVVEMWRHLGIPTLQVGPGDF